MRRIAQKGTRVPLNVTVDPANLKILDELCRFYNATRSAVVNEVLNHALTGSIYDVMMAYEKTRHELTDEQLWDLLYDPPLVVQKPAGGGTLEDVFGPSAQPAERPISPTLTVVDPEAL